MSKAGTGVSNGGTIDEVQDSAEVSAPLERLWALSTRVELVKNTLGMKLIGGTTTGFIGDGSRVVWKGWKFGLPTEHHTLITGFSSPHAAGAGATLAPELHADAVGQPVAWFQDSQERGRFDFFQHDHWFRQRQAADGTPVTVLEDQVRFRLPFGPLGRMATKIILQPYIRRLVKRRFASLKQLAEGDGWKQWV